MFSNQNFITQSANKSKIAELVITKQKQSYLDKQLQIESLERDREATLQLLNEAQKHSSSPKPQNERSQLLEEARRRQKERALLTDAKPVQKNWDGWEEKDQIVQSREAKNPSPQVKDSEDFKQFIDKEYLQLKIELENLRKCSKGQNLASNREEKINPNKSCPQLTENNKVNAKNLIDKERKLEKPKPLPVTDKEPFIEIMFKEPKLKVEKIESKERIVPKNDLKVEKSSIEILPEGRKSPLLSKVEKREVSVKNVRNSSVNPSESKPQRATWNDAPQPVYVDNRYPYQFNYPFYQYPVMGQYMYNMPYPQAFNPYVHPMPVPQFAPSYPANSFYSEVNPQSYAQSDYPEVSSHNYAKSEYPEVNTHNYSRSEYSEVNPKHSANPEGPKTPEKEILEEAPQIDYEEHVDLQFAFEKDSQKEVQNIQESTPVKSERQRASFDEVVLSPKNQKFSYENQRPSHERPKPSHESQKLSLEELNPVADKKPVLMEFGTKNSNSLADAFKEKKKAIADRIHNREDHIKKQDHKEKTKEELIEIRKNFVKMPKNEKPVFEIKIEEKKNAKEPSSELMERLAMGKRVKVSKEEMLKLNKKNYQLLPEVKRRQEEEKKKAEKQQRLMKAREYEKVRNM